MASVPSSELVFALPIAELGALAHITRHDHPAAHLPLCGLAFLDTGLCLGSLRVSGRRG